MDTLSFLGENAALFLAVLAFVLGVSCLALLGSERAAPIRPLRLALGYAAGIAVALGFTGLIVLAPLPALRREFGTPAENNIPALLEFEVVGACLAYLTVLGIATIGAPVAFAMARRGRGTVLRVVGASLVFSVLMFGAFAWIGGGVTISSFPWFMGYNMAAAAGLGLGLGLPLSHHLSAPSP